MFMMSCVSVCVGCLVLKLGKSQAKEDELVTLGQLLDGLRAECHTRQWRYREG